MPRRHHNLFDQIASFEALHRAALRSVRGKRKTARPAAFMAGLERELLVLLRRLESGSYRPGRYSIFDIYEPKHRVISAAPFRDRVVHHAVCDVIAPIFERGFVFDSFANRKGKGSHRAVARYEQFRDRYRYVLRCDIHRYFPAIDHEILKRDLARRISCARTDELLGKIIDGSNPQERVHHYFPGDGLFEPMSRRRGLPIGNLTSQLFSNIYLDCMDHWVKEVLRAPGYVRYVDDFALFADDRDELERWRARLQVFLEGRRLKLHEFKTGVVSTSEPAVFLGYELWRDGRRRVDEGNVRRFRNRLRGLRDLWCCGRIGRAEVETRVSAWIAHSAHANSHRLRQAIFKSGWFDPDLGPGRSPEAARRQLDQQRAQLPLSQPQQERCGQPEQQHRFSPRQHVCMPER